MISSQTLTLILTSASPMIHNGGFGESCGSTGIDKRRRILHVNMLTNTPRESLGAQVLPLNIIKERRRLNCLPSILRQLVIILSQDLLLGRDSVEVISQILDGVKGLLDGRGQFVVEDKQLGIGDLERMQEDGSCNLVVDEGGNDGQLEEREPGYHENRRVVKHHGDTVSGLDTLGHKPMGLIEHERDNHACK